MPPEAVAEAAGVCPRTVRKWVGHVAATSFQADCFQQPTKICCYAGVPKPTRPRAYRVPVDAIEPDYANLVSHPLASIMPMMSEDEFERHKADIKRNGCKSASISSRE